MTRTIPAVPTPVDAGTLLPAATATAWAQAINLGLNPPRCYVHLASAPAATALTTFTLVTWDTDDVDTDTILVAAHKSRLLFPYAGTWRVTSLLSLAISSGVTEFPQVSIRKNAAGSIGGGTEVGWIEGAGTGTGTGVVKGRHLVTVAANDYVEWFYGGYYPAGTGATLQPVAGTATFLAQVRMVSTT